MRTKVIVDEVLGSRREKREVVVPENARRLAPTWGITGCSDPWTWFAIVGTPRLGREPFGVAMLFRWEVWMTCGEILDMAHRVRKRVGTFPFYRLGDDMGRFGCRFHVGVSAREWNLARHYLRVLTEEFERIVWKCLPFLVYKGHLYSPESALRMEEPP